MPKMLIELSDDAYECVKKFEPYDSIEKEVWDSIKNGVLVPDNIYMQSKES